MTVSTKMLTLYSDTSEQFRAWGREISSSLKAVGLVQTENTGQIDWDTVIRQPSTNVANGSYTSGYEIYRFNDALQSSKPVFIRIFYGIEWNYNSSWGRFSAGGPSIWVWVGTSTDGGANITGTFTTQQQLAPGNYNRTNSSQPTADPAVVSSPCYFSGDGSSLQMCLGSSTLAQPLYRGPSSDSFTYPGTPYMVWIERSRDPDGTPNGDGVFFGTSQWKNTTIQSGLPTLPVTTWQALGFPGDAVQGSAIAPEWPIPWPGGNAFGTTVSGPDFTALPPSGSTPKACSLMGFLGMYRNDMANGAQLSLPVLGQPHNYISLGNISGTVNNDSARSSPQQTVSNAAVLMRWE